MSCCHVPLEIHLFIFFFLHLNDQIPSAQHYDPQNRRPQSLWQKSFQIKCGIYSSTWYAFLAP